jgi:hypothetical protein
VPAAREPPVLDTVGVLTVGALASEPLSMKETVLPLPLLMEAMRTLSPANVPL